MDARSRTPPVNRLTATSGSAQTGYEFDASGNLSDVIGIAGGPVSYTTNGDGLRVSRTHDGNTAQLTWSTVSSLPLVLDDGTTTYVYGPNSSPVIAIDNATGSARYLSADLVGTPRLATDDAGSISGTASYDAYGNPIEHTGTMPALGYTAGLTDADTGLVYLRARSYDPTTGQFTTVDPAIDTTRQPYAYAGNNPVLNTDPTGLCVGMDGTPQDRACTTNDFFWAGLPAAIGQGIGVGITGFTDGFTFDLSAAVAPQETCRAQTADPFGYNWAHGIGSVDASVVAFLATRGRPGSVPAPARPAQITHEGV